MKPMDLFDFSDRLSIAFDFAMAIDREDGNTFCGRLSCPDGEIVLWTAEFRCASIDRLDITLFSGTSRLRPGPWVKLAYRVICDVLVSYVRSMAQGVPIPIRAADRIYLANSFWRRRRP